MSRFFGTPEGIRVGQQFIDRRELHDLHVHRPLQAGISGTKAEGADSIVVSGGYIDDEDHGSWIVYTGHGGNDSNTGRQIRHQTIDAPGNAGLVTSRAEGLPVRVVRGRHVGSSYAPLSGYVYAGLFEVADYWIRNCQVQVRQVARTSFFGYARGSRSRPGIRHHNCVEADSGHRAIARN